MKTEKVFVPEFVLTAIQRRRNGEVFLSERDLLTWAYKGVAINTHPIAKQLFEMIAHQLENGEDER